MLLCVGQTRKRSLNYKLQFIKVLEIICYTSMFTLTLHFQCLIFSHHVETRRKMDSYTHTHTHTTDTNRTTTICLRGSAHQGIISLVCSTKSSCNSMQVSKYKFVVLYSFNIVCLYRLHFIFLLIHCLSYLTPLSVFYRLFLIILH